MVNKVIILGRIGKIPTLSMAKSGASVGNMQVATNKRVKGVDKTEWHRVVMFNKTAEFAHERLGVGALVYIEGELQTRKWDKNGVETYTTEIICNDLKVQDWGNQAGKEHERANKSTFVERDQNTMSVGISPIFSDDFDKIQPSFTEEDLPF